MFLWDFFTLKCVKLKHTVILCCSCKLHQSTTNPKGLIFPITKECCSLDKYHIIQGHTSLLPHSPSTICQWQCKLSVSRDKGRILWLQFIAEGPLPHIFWTWPCGFLGTFLVISSCQLGSGPKTWPHNFFENHSSRTAILTKADIFTRIGKHFNRVETAKYIATAASNLNIRGDCWTAGCLLWPAWLNCFCAIFKWGIFL